MKELPLAPTLTLPALPLPSVVEAVAKSRALEDVGRERHDPDIGSACRPWLCLDADRRDRDVPARPALCPGAALRAVQACLPHCRRSRPHCPQCAYAGDLCRLPPVADRAGTDAVAASG